MEAEILESLTYLRGGMDRLEKRFDHLEADVATLKSDVATLKSDVATLKSDVATLKSDVGTVKGRLDDTNRRIDFLSEQMVRGFTEVNRRVDANNARLDDVAHRTALIDARTENMMTTMGSAWRNHDDRLRAVEDRLGIERR